MMKQYESLYTTVIVIVYLFISGYFFLFTELWRSRFIFQEKDVLIFFLLAIAMFLSLYFVNRIVYFGSVGLFQRDAITITGIILFATFFIILPEEIFFRAYIQDSIASVIKSPAIVVIISSAVFGIAHILNGARGFKPGLWNWKLVLMSFVTGLYLGISYTLTNSLIVPILLHVLVTVVVKIFIKVG